MTVGRNLVGTTLDCSRHLIKKFTEVGWQTEGSIGTHHCLDCLFTVDGGKADEEDDDDAKDGSTHEDQEVTTFMVENHVTFFCERFSAFGINLKNCVFPKPAITVW